MCWTTSFGRWDGISLAKTSVRIMEGEKSKGVLGNKVTNGNGYH